VQSSAEHLLSLINDLLDVARLDANSKELCWEPVDCRALLEELAAMFQPQAERKGLAFGLQLPHGALVIRTDRRALRQILINLTGNAIKFTDTGSICIRLQTSVDGDESQWLFSVQDSGPGIAPTDRHRLFQAFSRLEPAERGALEGTGLGLHLSRKLALALRGALDLQDAAGQGSTFTLRLPSDGSELDLATSNST
jgi:protein-histidine pros-kinase